MLKHVKCLDLYANTQGERSPETFLLLFGSAIMHITTIVQNGIISIVYSCVIFVRLILIGLAKKIGIFIGLLKIYISPTVFIIEWWDKLHSVQE